MERLHVSLAATLLASTAGLAVGQVQYASGLLHTPLGGATLSPPTDRRLHAVGIGSSGQDGVEVQLNAVTGGEVYINLDPLVAAGVSGGEIKIKHKGWDGLIYHRHSLRPPGPLGPGVLHEADFTPMGAVSVRATFRDDSGTPIAEFVEPGGIVTIIDTATYAPGEVARTGMGAGKVNLSELRCRRKYDKTSPKLMLRVGGTMEVISNAASVEYFPIICITEPCPPSWPNLGSLQVTAQDISSIEVSDAALAWARPLYPDSSLASSLVLVHGGGGGSGGSRIAEEFHDVDGDGAPDECVRATNVSNDGSTAVTITVPPGAESASVHGNCCRGHVIIMKAFDDAGHEMRLGSFDNPVTGGVELTPDFSSVGATGSLATAYDASGAVLGVGFIGVGGVATINYDALCGPGAFPKFILDKFGNPYFIGCGQYYDLVLPGQPAISDVASVKFEPVGALSAFGTLVAIGAGSDSISGGTGDDILLGDYRVAAPPACDSIDFNGDGVFPDNQDAIDFIDVFAGAPCPTGLCGDLDFNNDGVFPDNADITKYFEVLAGAPC